MNDRYLFKAKRSSDGTWIFGCGSLERKHGTVLVWADRERRIFETYVDPSTLCQCTGLKDKNGNLIWENDVISVTRGNGTVEYATIEYYTSYTMSGFRMNPIKDWVFTAFDEAKIIGNIFDNPELLEVE